MSQDGPLGVRLIVTGAQSNFEKVELKPINTIVSNQYVDKVLIIFMAQLLT